MNTYFYYAYRKYLLYYLHSMSRVPERFLQDVGRVFSCYVLFKKFPYDRLAKQVSRSYIFIICYCIISKHSVITRFTLHRSSLRHYHRPHIHIIQTKIDELWTLWIPMSDGHVFIVLLLTLLLSYLNNNCVGGRSEESYLTSNHGLRARPCTMNTIKQYLF